jgi:hypothetical protein
MNVTESFHIFFSRSDLTEQRMPWVTPKPNKTFLSSQNRGFCFLSYNPPFADFPDMVMDGKL